MILEVKKKIWLAIVVFVSAGFFVLPARATDFGAVVINEIAWMGTSVDYNDEWIELYNNTEEPLNLDSWVLQARDGTPKIILSGIIQAGGFFVLERTDDQTLPNIAADKIYTGALGNSGEDLELKDESGNLIDALTCSSGWFAGDNSRKQTMERKNSRITGNNPDNWGTSQNPGGTPKAQNSVFQSSEPTPTPTPTPTLSPISTPTPTPTPTPILTPDLTPVPTPAPTSTPPPTPASTPTLTPAPSPTSTPTPLPVSSPVSTPKPVYSRSVIINEFIPNPVGDDAEGEWIELFNEGSGPIDLSGWKLADKTSKFTIPQNTIIGAKNYLVFNRLTSKLSINNDGEILSLFDPGADLAFKISYDGKAPEGQSLARQSDGQWLWTTLLTPGKQNIIKVAETKTESKIAPTKTSSNQDSQDSLQKTLVTSDSGSSRMSPLPLDFLVPTALPGREEVAGAPLKSSKLVFPTGTSNQDNLNQGKAEENYFLNKNQTAAVVKTDWLNYKITGLAILIGIFSVAGILILKKFLI